MNYTYDYFLVYYMRGYSFISVYIHNSGKKKNYGILVLISKMVIESKSIL